MPTTIERTIVDNVLGEFDIPVKLFVFNDKRIKFRRLKYSGITPKLIKSKTTLDEIKQQIEQKVNRKVEVFFNSNKNNNSRYTGLCIKIYH